MSKDIKEWLDDEANGYHAFKRGLTVTYSYIKGSISVFDLISITGDEITLNAIEDSSNKEWNQFKCSLDTKGKHMMITNVSQLVKLEEFIIKWSEECNVIQAGYTY